MEKKDTLQELFKAQDIVRKLWYEEKGGEVSKRLKLLDLYMSRMINDLYKKEK